MAKRNRKDVITPLLDRYGPEIELAFLASIDTITRDADFNRIVRALRQGNLDDAVAALHVDDAAFSRFADALSQAYVQGGGDAIGNLPVLFDDVGNRLVIRFDARDLFAEDTLRAFSSSEIREISEDTRTMARDVLARGLQRGDNPRTVALDLIGKIDPITGERVGGFIGLTSRQATSVQNARLELLSGEETQLNNYLGRKLRNKNFDGYVKRAIKSGLGIDATIINKAITALKNRTLKFRGDMIGRTEALSALHLGQYEAFEQALRTGQLTEDEIEREWQTAGDDRVRHTHQELHGQKVGMHEDFVVPSNGDRIRIPGDPRAKASERINCRCTNAIRVNFLRRLKKS